MTKPQGSPVNTGAIVPRPDDSRYKRQAIVHLIRKAVAIEPTNLGVSLAYAVRLVEKHDLSEEEIDLIVHARLEYGASLVKIDHWLRRGLTAGEVARLYQVRSEFNAHWTTQGKGKNPTIGLITIARFAEVFSEMDLGEPVHLASQLIEILEVLQPVFPFIEYQDTILKMVLSAKRTLGCTELGTAVEAVLDRKQWQDRNEKMRTHRFSWRHDTDEDDDS
ncbi:MAG: hypothetical protein HYT46_03695 [Candidatus Vogelbacteria bacterium]|nr:hypothetical protein [Candidatus Vogelbacteria bacterium]